MVRRRGFTLIEVMLAAMIGALLVSACVAMFGAAQKSDRKLAGRFGQGAELGRLQTTVRKALGSLVMSMESPPTRTDDAGTSGTGGSTGGAGAAAGADGSAAGESAGAPRFLLEPDAYLNVGAGSVQRLEVVLMQSPLPVPPGAVELGLVSGQAAAVRGVFELRPDGPNVKPVPGTERTGWTLWWKPLPPVTTESAEGDVAEPRAIDPSETPGAVPLATGLVKAEWKAFKQRQWAAGIAATNMVELPAYVTLAVETTAGLKADWMFELSWSNGPEVIEEEETVDVEVGEGGMRLELTLTGEQLSGGGSFEVQLSPTLEMDRGGGRGEALRSRGRAPAGMTGTRAGSRSTSGVAWPGPGGFGQRTRSGGGGGRGTPAGGGGGR